MLCHFLTVLSLQKKRDFWRSISLALGFLYVQNRVKLKKIQVISILILNCYECHFNLIKSESVMMNHWKQFWCLGSLPVAPKSVSTSTAVCDDFGTGATNHYFGQKDGPPPPIFFIALFRIPCTKNVLGWSSKSRGEG